MRSKEEYIKIRNQTEVPVELFYEFWKETKPSHYSNLTYGEFAAPFLYFMAEAEGFTVPTPNGMKRISYEAAVNKVFRHFNEKFEL